MTSRSADNRRGVYFRPALGVLAVTAVLASGLGAMPAQADTNVDRNASRSPSGNSPADDVSSPQSKANPAPDASEIPPTDPGQTPSTPPATADQAPPSEQAQKPAPQDSAPQDSVEPRARKKSGVKLSKVRVRKNGRLVTASVVWNKRMIARVGRKEAFRVTLTGFPTDPATAPVVYVKRSARATPPRKQRLRLKISKRNAAHLRAATDVVLSVSQHYDDPSDNDTLFERGYVTTRHLPRTQARSTAANPASDWRVSGLDARATSDCSSIELVAPANLSGCDFDGANLTNANLNGLNFSGATFRGAKLSGATFNGANVEGADFSNAVGANLTGSVGTPAVAPPATLSVASITPPAGPKSGGTAVTITGTGFERSATATIGGTNCSGTGESTATTLTCTTGPGTAGAADIVITNRIGNSATLAGGYTYETGAYLYWSGSNYVSYAQDPPTQFDGFLGRTGIEGGSFNPNTQPFISTDIAIDGDSETTGIATDENYVYWANDFQGTIGRANLDGSSANPSFISLGAPLQALSNYDGWGVALAVTDSHIYWYNSTTGFVGRADINGNNANTSLVNTSVQNPTGQAALTVDDNYLYWTNNATGVSRADIDGSNVSQNFLTTQYQVNGLAVDGKYLYFSNEGQIGRADIDGQNSVPAWFQGSDNASELTVDGRYLYWVDELGGTGQIGRVALDNPSTFSNPFLMAAVWFRGSIATDLTPFPKSVTKLDSNGGAGTQVTINGFGFASDATVTIGGVDCAKYTSTRTALTCVAGAGPSGAVDVVVTNGNSQTGTITDGFTYGNDPAPPLAVTGIQPAYGAQAGGTPVSISGTGFAPGAIATIGRALCSSPTTASQTTLTCTTPPGPAGSADVEVINPDSNSARKASVFTYLDEYPNPNPTGISTSQAYSYGGMPLTITGTDFRPGATVTFVPETGSSVSCSVTTNSSTSLACTVDSSPSYAITFDVVVTNLDNRTGTLTQALTLTGGPPTITAIDTPNGPLSGGTSITITGGGFYPTYTTVAIGGVACPITQWISVSQLKCTSGNNTDNGPGTYDVVVSTLLPGDTSLPDEIHNPSATLAQAFSYQVGTVSITNSNLPIYGSTSGGDWVELISTGGLFNVASISLGGVDCSSINYDSDTAIVCLTGAHALGVVDLVVTMRGGGSTTVPNFFSYLYPAPTITGFNSPTGPTSGGTPITITGTGFDDTATVTFANEFGGDGTGPACTNVQFVNSTTITCTTPPASAELLAQTPIGGALAPAVTISQTNHLTGVGGGFYYLYPTPTIASIAPTFGLPASETPLTITGTGFFPETVVSIGGQTCPVTGTTTAQTQISCTAPAGAVGYVDVIVTNKGVDPSNNELPDGIGLYEDHSATASAGFAYANPAPTIETIDPVQGATEGSTPVTLHGTNFIDGMTITIGGQECPAVTVQSSESATCTTTPKNAGASDVIVTNPGPYSVGTLTGGYTYVVVNPTIRSLSPVTGATAGTTLVTITGTNFYPLTTFSFGGAACIPISPPTATSVMCHTSEHTAGPVDVVATNPGPGSPTGLLASGYTYTGPLPPVAQISPTSGTNLGGTQVTITYPGLDPAATATIGGAECANPSVNAELTELTCTTGAAVAGPADVVVTFPNWQSSPGAALYTYNASTVSYIFWAGQNTSDASIGSIGRSNLDGTNSQPDFINTGQGAAMGPVSDGLYVYYLNNAGDGSIGRANIDGTGVNNNWIPNSSARNPGALAVDDNYLYMLAYSYFNCGEQCGPADLLNLGISRFNLSDGSPAGYGSTNGNDFIPITAGISLGASPPAGLPGLAVADGAIYWTDTVNGVIGSALLAAAPDTSAAPGTPNFNLITGITNLSGLTVAQTPMTQVEGEPPYFAVYWSNTNQWPVEIFESTISQAGLDDGGSGPSTLVVPNQTSGNIVTDVWPEPLPPAIGLGTDSSGSNVYMITETSLTGYNVQTPAWNPSTGSPFDIQTGAVGGVTVSPVAPSPSISAVTPGSIASTGGAWVNITGTGLGTNALITIGGVPCTIPPLASNTSTNVTCIAGPSPAGNADVVVVNRDGQLNDSPGAVTYADQKAYNYTVTTDSSDTPHIARNELGGLNSDPAWISPWGPPPDDTPLSPDYGTGIAVDGTYVYFANGGSIGQASVADGSVVNPTLVLNAGTVDENGITSLNAVAVNHDYLFWANGNYVGRSYLDGTGANAQFINTGGSAFGSLVVDDDFVYWAGSQGVIGRAGADGSNPNLSFINPGANGYIDNLAVGAGQIFWTQNGPTVGSAQLNGAGAATNINPTFLTGVDDGSPIAASAGWLYYVSNGWMSTYQLSLGAGAASTPANQNEGAVYLVGSYALTPGVGPVPVVTSVSPPTGSTLGGTKVTLTGSGFRASTNNVKIGGVECTSVEVKSPTSLECTTGDHTAVMPDFGTVDVVVTNVDTQSATLAGGFNYQPPVPTVTAIHANQGMFSGGASVSITGTGFDPNLSVTIGEVPCTRITVGGTPPNTALQCTTGAHAAGPAVDVVVTNPNNVVGQPLVAGYTYRAYAPRLTSVSPQNGPVNQTTVLTLTGNYFDTNASVTVGTQACALVVGQVSSNRLQCTAPTGTQPGPVDVTVTNSDGQVATLVAGFTYLPPNPTILRISPDSGTTGGGTPVTIYGTGFVSTGSSQMENPQVYFDAAPPCANVSVSNEGDQITCTTSPSIEARVTSLRVYNPLYDSDSPGQWAGLADAFTYVVTQPTVAAISPANGSMNVPTMVTITGTNFDPNATVTIGGNPCRPGGPTIGTTLTCIAPSTATAGQTDVVVTNPNSEIGTLAGGFTYGTYDRTSTDLYVATSEGGTNNLEHSTIGGAPTDSTLLTNAQFGGVAVDENFIYMAGNNADFSLNGIVRTNLDGTNPTTLMTGAMTGVAVDDNYIYWTSQNQNNIGRSNLDGTSPNPAFIQTDSAAAGIAVSGSRICWSLSTDLAAASSVWCASLDGTDAGSMVVLGFSTEGVAVDDNYVYWSNYDAGYIGRAALDDSYIDPLLITGLTHPTALAVDGYHIYWSATSGSNTSPVGQANLDGTGVNQGFVNVNLGWSSGIALNRPWVPTVLSVSDSSGPPVGGTPITIKGERFDPSATVTIGGKGCQNTSYVDANTITCTTPGHVTGVAPVVVTNANSLGVGTLESGFTYTVPAPTISTVSPNTGPFAGGTSVTITGTDFHTATTVTIGGTGCPVTGTTTPTQITCTVAANTTHPAISPVDVTVTNPDNQAATKSAAFTYTTTGNLFWANSSGPTGFSAATIGQQPITDGSASQGYLQPSGVGAVSGVATDATYVYWTDSLNGTIGRARLDGTGTANPNFVPSPVSNPLNQPTGLVIHNGVMYWANTGGGSIGAASLPEPQADSDTAVATNVSTFISADSDNGQLQPGSPTGVATDGTYIYWANNQGLNVSAPNVNGIGRALISGNGAAGVEVNWLNTDTTNTFTPTGVATDGTYIYWTSQASNGNAPGAIGRARLDGTGQTVANFVPATVDGTPSGAATSNNPQGLTVTTTHIYWANSGGAGTIGGAELPAVESADATATNPNPSYITGAGTPQGVASN